MKAISSLTPTSRATVEGKKHKDAKGRLHAGPAYFYFKASRNLPDFHSVLGFSIEFVAWFNIKSFVKSIKIIHDLIDAKF